MLRRLIIYTLCYFFFCTLQATAQQRAIRPVEPNSDSSVKQALVIGNSAYKYTSPLRNPVNDAKEIAKTLKRLGFGVTTLLDGNQRRMEQAINSFGNNLRGKKGVGLFYYAGHGMQVQGENYLLPIDISPRTAADVRYDAVPVGKLLGQLEDAANGMNLVILDACRNNPFSRNFRSSTQGLAQVNAPTGTFVSYSTAPGRVAADGDGENGLFTSKLLKYMVVPGLKLEDVFKKVRKDVQRDSNNQQVPWESSSITGDFYFIEREEEARRKEEEILQKRKEDTPSDIQKQDTQQKPLRIRNETTVNGNLNKFKLMGGYSSSSLKLEKDPASGKEELNSTGLFLSFRYFLGRNIGLDFHTASGDLRKITFSDGTEERERQAVGKLNTTLLGVSYNWGGDSSSLFGNWWTVIFGLGAGSSTAKYTPEDTQEEVTATTQGLAILLGVDYRTESNWLLGLTFYGVDGNPTGSRIKQLESEGKEVTASSFSTTVMVGYQFDQ